MLSSAEARHTSLMVIHGSSMSWAIPSGAVSGVEPYTVSDQAPVDVLALLGAEVPIDLLSRRVMLVKGRGAPVRLLVHGDLALEQLPHDALLPLPAALQSVAPLITHIAIADGKPSWFVVSPERLLHRCGSVSR